MWKTTTQTPIQAEGTLPTGYNLPTDKSIPSYLKLLFQCNMNRRECLHVKKIWVKPSSLVSYYDDMRDYAENPYMSAFPERLFTPTKNYLCPLGISQQSVQYTVFLGINTEGKPNGTQKQTKIVFLELEVPHEIV